MTKQDAWGLLIIGILGLAAYIAYSLWSWLHPDKRIEVQATEPTEPHVTYWRNSFGNVIPIVEMRPVGALEDELDILIEVDRLRKQGLL